MEDDPEYVVRRFESGRYAVDSECRRVYQRALDLVEVGLMYNVCRSSTNLQGFPTQ